MDRHTPRTRRLDAFLVDTRKARRTLIAVGIFLTAVLLAGNVAIYLASIGREMRLALAERRGLAALAAETLAERFRRLEDVATALASRVLVQEHVAAGRWEDAIAALRQVSTDFPYVERVFLTDPAGTLLADAPALPGVRGSTFSSRDWYRGVSAAWQPYISNVYKRAAPPQLNVVAVAAPIREDGVVVGILVMQVRLEQLLAWSKEVDFGPSATVSYVDALGQVAAHPDMPLQSDIVDRSDVPEVAEALAGRTGARVARDATSGEDRVVAFAAVPDFGWGVLLEQPAAVTLTQVRAQARQLLALQMVWVVSLAATAGLLLLLLDRLRVLRQQQSLLLESIGDGVLAIDRDWNVTLLNPAAERLTGWKREEAIGKPLRQVARMLYEHSDKENVSFIEEAMVFGEPRTIVEKTVLVRRDGRQMPISDSAAPIRDERGDIIGAIVVFRDATLEREAMEMRSDFTYAAHQLRTPVTKALWSVEEAMAHEERPAVRKTIEEAYLALKSVVRLNDQLLLVSQLDQGLVHPDREYVHLQIFVAALVKDVGMQCRAHNLTLETPTIPQTWGLETDPELLRRALEEVLDNAVAYAAERSTVSLEVSARREGYVFVVRNTGVGIQPEQHPLVFTKFFRGSNFDTTRIVGAGLGLYIAREYLALLGGTIAFTSVEGGETAFTVFLPKGKPATMPNA